MQNETDDVFSPIELRYLPVKNRIVRSATNDYAAESDGSVSTYQIEIIRKLAENEVGLIITGNFCVSVAGRNGRDQHILYGDFDRTALTELVRSAHVSGCRIVAQLGHAGGKAKRADIDVPDPVAPSDTIYIEGEPAAKALSIDEIKRLVGDFATAARTAREASFDGVQLHCAHGYLLSQFLSPQQNLRTDKYGGSPANRFRIVEEIITAIRSLCGAEFPILVKMNGNAPGKAETYFEDVRYFVGRCETLGLTAVEISGFDFLTFDKDKGPYYTDIISALRPMVQIPLIAVGGVRSLKEMKAVLRSGADMVALSRPFICESHLITRLKAGQERAKCISCNKCFSLYKKEKRRCVFQKTMRVRVLLHLEHEGLGLLRNAFLSRGAKIAESNLWKGESLPELESFDFLVVMGGAMNVDEDARFPWLSGEKKLIADAIASDKRVLGICLGAQLIARALGAKVRPMGYKEIGWFPVRAECDGNRFFKSLAKGGELGMAHWHGDTFALPEGCDRLFSSEACPEQGFAVREKTVVALQFHAELDEAMFRSFIEHGGDELTAGGEWVQQAETALHGLKTEGAAARKVLDELVAELFA
ncbi:MAG: hypothetical protein WCT14_15075 [Treponemataceae bacterium]